MLGVDIDAVAISGVAISGVAIIVVVVVDVEVDVDNAGIVIHSEEMEADLLLRL